MSRRCLLHNIATVVLADDHPVVRQGLRQAIESDQSLKVVAEAGDRHQALELVKRLKPEIVVLDIDMPGLDGLAVARAIGEQNLGSEIIFLTIHREEDLFARRSVWVSRATC